jgi:eukaryotic-like serine/threonine-protein kinase
MVSAVGPNPGEAVGAVLSGHWKLTRLIGEGGLAAVYEADDLRGGQKRAIKLLHPQFVSNRAVVERFYAEAQASFSLRHPHIAVVEAYDYAEDGSPYIVMELLRGVNLEEYLGRHPPMGVELAAPIMYGVLQALGVAHAKGIVHRDLKPPNLFLVPDAAGRYTVKVLDFGIAKVMDLAGGMGTKTRTGAVLGTPGYMSPEQVKNAKAVDARTDLWAAGVVFFEMLTGKHPFGASDNLARMVAVLREPPTPISRVAPHLAAWGPFFERALARDPAHRFGSAEEMANALYALAQGSARIATEGSQTVSMRQVPEATAQAALSVAPAMSATPRTVGTMASPVSVRTTEAMPAVTQSTPPPSAYPSHHPNAYPSAPPPAQVLVPAPPAGYQAAGATKISEGRPTGTPTFHSDVPQIRVEEAADIEPPSLVWWGVALVGAGCFALGLLLGYVLGAS